jgi:cytochrome c peroxidase
MQMKKLALVTIVLALSFGLYMLGSRSSALAQEPVPASGDIVTLGKALFFDTTLSQPGGQSCATCHEPFSGFADPRSDLPVSAGVLPLRYGNRNAPSAAYAAFSPTLHFDPTMRPGIMGGMYVGGLFWDGRAMTLEEQAKAPFLNPLEMHNLNKVQVVNAVRNGTFAELFKEVFGPQSLLNVEEAYDDIALAVTAYERSSEVNAFSSKFDYYLAGEAQLTEKEANGYALFIGKAKCTNCHTGTPDAVDKPILFTSYGYQNIGVPKNLNNPFYSLPKPLNPAGGNYVDLGLGAVLKDPMQNGKFKIPTLRNVAVTAPYMHNGYFATLREVVEFDNTRDVNPAWPAPEVPANVHRHMPPMPGTFGQLGLNDQEIDDIVAFLQTLTDGYQP